VQDDVEDRLVAARSGAGLSEEVDDAEATAASTGDPDEEPVR
jgi:hypothetical protein